MLTRVSLTWAEVVRHRSNFLILSSSAKARPIRTYVILSDEAALSTSVILSDEVALSTSVILSGGGSRSEFAGVEGPLYLQESILETWFSPVFHTTRGSNLSTEDRSSR